MNISCPISQNRVDSNLVRVTSVIVMVSSLTYVLTQNEFFILILALDFTARVFRYNKYSPLFQIGFMILHLTHTKQKLSDEAPKRFALYLGWIMLLLTIISISFGLKPFAVALSVILFACSSLEAFFEYCLGCKIYQLLKIYKLL